MSNVTKALAEGAACGLVATAVMSGGFLAGQRAGTIGTLPPTLIVKRFLPRLPDRVSRVVAIGAHLGYGAAAGAVYGLLRAKTPRTGLAFGLVVWATSYELWVPAARVLPPAHRDVRSRALTIFGAHLIYGLTLGAVRRPSRRK